MYAMIGCSLLRGTLLICDPGVNELTERINTLEAEQKQFIRLDDMKTGGYYSYHIGSSDAPTLAKELIYLHESVAVSEVENLTSVSLGTVSASYSGSVVLCEESKAFDARNTYFYLEADAFYDSASLLGMLAEEKMSEDARKRIMSICNEHKTDGYVLGREFVDALDNYTLPECFKKAVSTHWSEDIARKLRSVPAVSIVGGVASNADYGMLPVSKLMKDNEIVGIRIVTLND